MGGVGGSRSGSCTSTNISVATNCGTIRLVGGRVTHAGGSNYLSSINNFNNYFNLPITNVRRPMLIDNASNYNAGIGLTVLVSGRSAVNVSTITVYIGSVVYINTGPLFFLSCVTYNGGVPRGVTRVINNIDRNYMRSNTTLVNNRATRRPNVVPVSSCSLTNFTINVISGGGVLSGAAVRRSSIIVTLPSDNVRSGKFSLIHGIFSMRGYSLAGACRRLNNGSVNRILLAPAGVCMGPILRLLSGMGMHTVSRVANNNFCRGVPEDVPSNFNTRVMGSSIGILPVFSLLRGANGVPRESVCGACGVNINVDVIITGRSASGTLRVLGTGNRSTCVVNGVIGSSAGVAVVWNMGVGGVTILISNNKAGLRTLVGTRVSNVVASKGVALIISGGPSTCTLAHTGGDNVGATIYGGGSLNSGFRSTLVRVLRRGGVSFVILTNFVYVLSRGFASQFTGHVVGIRPSLVPSFYNGNFCKVGIRRTTLTCNIGIANTAIRFMGRVPSNNGVVVRGTMGVLSGSAPRALRGHMVRRTR